MATWENHAKMVDVPKKAWREPDEPAPQDGDSLALEQRRFRMYDHRPVELPLAVDPNQPAAHGRVWKIRLNDVSVSHIAGGLSFITAQQLVGSEELLSPLCTYLSPSLFHIRRHAWISGSGMQVPTKFEEAQELADAGRLQEASRLLIKVRCTHDKSPGSPRNAVVRAPIATACRNFSALALHQSGCRGPCRAHSS